MRKKNLVFAMLLISLTGVAQSQSDQDDPTTEQTTNIYEVEGNVGVGIEKPTAKLHVDGDIRTEKDVVFTGAGKIVPDNYNLKMWAINDLSLATDGGMDRINITKSGNVGVGLEAPTSKLHVNGDIRTDKDYVLTGAGKIVSENGKMKMWAVNDLILGANGGTSVLHVNKDGRVGIGVENPQAALHIVSNGYGGLKMRTGADQNFLQLLTVEGEDKRIEFCNRPGGRAAIYTPSTGDVFNVHTNGSVTIGTDAQSVHRLGVNGSIRANKIVVDSNWADFVFEDDYKLPTIEEVERFISENGHLKDMPTAAEIAKNGNDLADTDVKLLQKIEELTLYVIDLQKQIKKQNELIKKSSKK